MVFSQWESGNSTILWFSKNTSGHWESKLLSQLSTPTTRWFGIRKGVFMSDLIYLSLQWEDCVHLHCSHLGQMSTVVDPRILSKVVFDFPARYDIKPYTSIKNMFRPLVKAAHILKSVNLRGKVAVVTGANSGLGKFTVHTKYAL